jgi:hypothetical protein
VTIPPGHDVPSFGQSHLLPGAMDLEPLSTHASPPHSPRLEPQDAGPSSSLLARRRRASMGLSAPLDFATYSPGSDHKWRMQHLRGGDLPEHRVIAEAVRDEMRRKTIVPPSFAADPPPERTVSSRGYKRSAVASLAMVRSPTFEPQSRQVQRLADREAMPPPTDLQTE